MKVYITKYALTSGIKEADAKLCSTCPEERMIDVGGYQYFFKPHWHENKDAAVIHANVMKQKKIESLKKQIKKLEALSFE